MWRFLADENLKQSIIDGLKSSSEKLDIARVVDVGLTQTDDRSILEWASQENRIMITHDFKTMIGFAHDRVVESLPMPGLIAINIDLPVGQAIAYMRTIIQTKKPADLYNQVFYAKKLSKSISKF